MRTRSKASLREAGMRLYNRSSVIAKSDSTPSERVLREGGTRKETLFLRAKMRIPRLDTAVVGDEGRDPAGTAREKKDAFGGGGGRTHPRRAADLKTARAKGSALGEPPLKNL